MCISVNWIGRDYSLYALKPWILLFLMVHLSVSPLPPPPLPLLAPPPPPSPSPPSPPYLDWLINIDEMTLCHLALEVMRFNCVCVCNSLCVGACVVVVVWCGACVRACCCMWICAHHQLTHHMLCCRLTHPTSSAPTHSHDPSTPTHLKSPIFPRRTTRGSVAGSLTQLEKSHTISPPPLPPAYHRGSLPLCTFRQTNTTSSGANDSSSLSTVTPTSLFNSSSSNPSTRTSPVPAQRTRCESPVYPPPLHNARSSPLPIPSSVSQKSKPKPPVLPKSSSPLLSSSPYSMKSRQFPPLPHSPIDIDKRPRAPLPTEVMEGRWIVISVMTCCNGMVWFWYNLKKQVVGF